MERFRSLMPALVLLGGTGCAVISKPLDPPTPVEKIGHEALQAVNLDTPPAPATEFACSWGKRLQQLPDPTRGGQMVPGIAGQVFLFSSDLQPAMPNGELTISATDATTRAPGVPPAKMEVWHFTPEVLKKMRVGDERYGISVAVFLPWPESWKDVNRLTIQARYDQKDVKGGQTLYAQPTTLTLDFSPAEGASAGGVIPGQFQRLNAVPDPRSAIQATRQPQPVNRAEALPPVQPAAATTSVPSPSPTSTGIDGEFRSVIPRR